MGRDKCISPSSPHHRKSNEALAHHHVEYGFKDWISNNCKDCRKVATGVLFYSFPILFFCCTTMYCFAVSFRGYVVLCL